MKTTGNNLVVHQISSDNRGRRSGGDRRNFSYTLHIPEIEKAAKEVFRKEEKAGNVATVMTDGSSPELEPIHENSL